MWVGGLLVAVLVVVEKGARRFSLSLSLSINPISPPSYMYPVESVYPFEHDTNVHVVFPLDQSLPNLRTPRHVALHVIA